MIWESHRLSVIIIMTYSRLLVTPTLFPRSGHWSYPRSRLLISVHLLSTTPLRSGATATWAGTRKFGSTPSVRSQSHRSFWWVSVHWVSARCGSSHAGGSRKSIGSAPRHRPSGRWHPALLGRVDFPTLSYRSPVGRPRIALW